MIQDDFLPIFKMEFKSFEWKNGWMFCAMHLIKNEVKYYHVGNLTYTKFSAFISCIEDFLLILLYLEDTLTNS